MKLCLGKSGGIWDKINHIGKTQWVQFLRFCMVGISNACVALGVYYFCLSVGLTYWHANIWGWIISVLNAFYWNNKYVFHRQGNLWRALAKTYISYGGSLLLGMVLLVCMVEQFGISERVAPVINIILITPFNFCLNKFWAFKEGGKKH